MKILFAFLLLISGTLMAESAPPLDEEIKNNLIVYQDFPTVGTVFRDISPILENPLLFTLIIDDFYARYKDAHLDAIVALDARGFLLGAPLAYTLNLPLVMIRKDGKLPGDVYRASYEKLYGRDTLCMRKDALLPGERVLIVDDIFSTGGTLKASCELIQAAGATVHEAVFLINNRQVLHKQTFEFPIYAIATL